MSASVYRTAPLEPRRAPRAPWWRLLRAWADGTLQRLRERRAPRGPCHLCGAILGELCNIGLHG